MQIVQKHKLFAMKFVDVKNKKGTALTLGINPVGLHVYRLNDTSGDPVVKFGWAECAELSYTEKKFKIEVHDRETKAFSVYCSRSQICQQVLHLCIGLHRLFVQEVRNWAGAPKELAQMRELAAKASIAERKDLKADSEKAAERARAVQTMRQRQGTMWTKPAGAAPSSSAANDTKAAAIAAAAAAAEEDDYIDVVVSDEDFMKMQQATLVQMEEDLGGGYSDILGDEEDEHGDVIGDLGGASAGAGAGAGSRERCQSEAMKDRAAYLESLGHAV